VFFQKLLGFHGGGAARSGGGNRLAIALTDSRLAAVSASRTGNGPPQNEK
jgi:hypothetical protein